MAISDDLAEEWRKQLAEIGDPLTCCFCSRLVRALQDRDARTETLELAAEALHFVQWRGPYGECPVCRKETRVGHSEGCALRAALDAAVNLTTGEHP